MAGKVRPIINLVPSDDVQTDEMQTPSWKPWTVKGVAMEERAFMIDAAKRAGQTIGNWLIDTAHQRVRREQLEEMKRAALLLGPEEAEAVSLALDRAFGRTLTMPEIIALDTEMRAAAGTRGCGRVAAQMRRLVGASLDAYLEPVPTTSRLLSPPRNKVRTIES